MLLNINEMFYYSWPSLLTYDVADVSCKQIPKDLQNKNNFSSPSKKIYLFREQVSTASNVYFFFVSGLLLYDMKKPDVTSCVGLLFQSKLLPQTWETRFKLEDTKKGNDRWRPSWELRQSGTGKWN